MAKRNRKVPGINASSTADIAFMLLIFFLITTSMDTDRGLARRLPPPPENDQQKNDGGADHGRRCDFIKIQFPEPVVVKMLHQIHAFVRIIPCHQPCLPEDLEGIQHRQHHNDVSGSSQVRQGNPEEDLPGRSPIYLRCLVAAFRYR